jgi:predicted kinase
MEDYYNTHQIEKKSSSKVILMCGPAGSGKSTVAITLESKGMIRLSFDEESFKRGIKVHPLPEDIAKEVKVYLDEKLISLIELNVDIVLDYSFWSKGMRKEYITLLKNYDINPTIYYIDTPKEIVMERIRNRKGNHQNDIILSEDTASMYYDNFEPPTADEGEVIKIKGF